MRTKSNTAPFPRRPPRQCFPHPLSASCRMREARHEADTPPASHDCRLTAIGFTLIELFVNIIYEICNQFSYDVLRKREELRGEKAVRKTATDPSPVWAL